MMLVLKSALTLAVASATLNCRVKIFTQCKSSGSSLFAAFTRTCDRNTFDYFDADVSSGLPSVGGYEVEGDCQVRFFTEDNYGGSEFMVGMDWCFCNTLGPASYSSMRIEEPVPDDAFTVVFFSDVEENYRGHKHAHAQRVVDAMKDIKNEGRLFDSPFNTVSVDPELFIHGGDLSNYWNVDWLNDLFGNDDGANNAWTQTWKDFYNADIPFITVHGNHDWHEADGTLSGGDINDNKDTRDFVQTVMEHAASVSSDLTYERIEPAHSVGQSYYKVDFKGVRIGLMGWEALKKSSDNDGSGPYDEDSQWTEFTNLMQADKTTLLVSHVPLDSQDDKTNVRLFMDRFEDAAALPAHNGVSYPMAAHLSGHTHRWDVKGYRGSSSNKVRDYTVTYPYDNYGDSGEKRGYYALLVSPSKGVLQVKQFEFTTNCKKAGKTCDCTTCANDCCYDGGVDYDWSWSSFSCKCK